MIVLVRKVGSSLVITLPATLVEALGLKEGDFIFIDDSSIKTVKEANLNIEKKEE